MNTIDDVLMPFEIDQSEGQVPAMEQSNVLLRKTVSTRILKEDIREELNA